MRLLFGITQEIKSKKPYKIRETRGDVKMDIHSHLPFPCVQDVWKMKRSTIGSAVLLIADYMVLLAAFIVAKWFRVWLGEQNAYFFFMEFYFPFQTWMLAVPLLTVSFIAYEGMYTQRLPLEQGAQRMF